MLANNNQDKNCSTLPRLRDNRKVHVVLIFESRRRHHQPQNELMPSDVKCSVIPSLYKQQCRDLTVTHIRPNMDVWLELMDECKRAELQL